MKIGVIVSHRSTSLGFFPKATRDALNSTIARYNHKHKNQVNVEIALDYEGFQDLQNKGQTQSSIKKSMLNLREKYDELIFLLLVDGELGEGQENEYSHIQTINGNLPADKKFHIHALIKWFEGCSDKSYPQLMNKKDETKPVCEWYKDDDNFERLVYEMLDGVASSKGPGNFWLKVLKAFILLIIAAILVLIVMRVKEMHGDSSHSLNDVPTPMDSTAIIPPGGQDPGNSNDSTNVNDTIIRQPISRPTPKPKPMQYIKNGCAITSNTNNQTIIDKLTSELQSLSLGLSFLSEGTPEWEIKITCDTLHANRVLSSGKTEYKSTVTIIAKIIDNKDLTNRNTYSVEKRARSYESQDKASNVAINSAISELAVKLNDGF